MQMELTKLSSAAWLATAGAKLARGTKPDKANEVAIPFSPFLVLAFVLLCRLSAIGQNA